MLCSNQAYFSQGRKILRQKIVKPIKRLQKKYWYCRFQQRPVCENAYFLFFFSWPRFNFKREEIMTLPSKIKNQLAKTWESYLNSPFAVVKEYLIYQWTTLKDFESFQGNFSRRVMFFGLKSQLIRSRLLLMASLVTK